MSIENITPENIPEKTKSSSETKENFSRDEQKLINDYSKEKNLIQNEMIDPSNMEAETKKVGGEARRSNFFEKNYKKIINNPNNYPTLYPLLQTFLENNKKAVTEIFTEIFANMKKEFTVAEMKIIDDIYISDERKTWMTQNPEKNKRIVRDKFCDISLGNMMQIMQDPSIDMNNYTNIVPWYIETETKDIDNDIKNGSFSIASEKNEKLQEFIRNIPKKSGIKPTITINDVLQQNKQITEKEEQSKRKKITTNIVMEKYDTITDDLNDLLFSNDGKKAKEKLQTKKDDIVDIMKALYDKSKSIPSSLSQNATTDQKISEYEKANAYLQTLGEIKDICLHIDNNFFSDDMFFQEFFDDTEKLQKQLTTFIDSGGTTEINFDTMEFFGPNPVDKDQEFNIYLGHNSNQFDMLEIFDVSGRLVYKNDEIQNILYDDTNSAVGKTMEDAKRIAFVPSQKISNIAAGMYIFRVSKKGSNDNVSKKFVVI